MYKMSWPNRITITRILLIGPFVIALMHLQDGQWSEYGRWSALVIFALMALSDGVDGYLARRLREESAVGRILDPLADKLLVLFSVVLLAHEGTHVTDALLPPTVVVIAIGKDLIIVLGFCIVYLVTSRTYIDPRRPGKLCTTVQMLMVIAILLAPSFPPGYRPVPRVLWWVASVLAVIATVHYFQLARQFMARHESAVENDQIPGPAGASGAPARRPPP